MILNVPNPFRPGAGRVPPELVGRSSYMADFSALLAAVSRDGIGDRPWVISGLRGMGKTVLLNHFARDAAERAWLVIKIEARADQSLANQLANETYVALRKVASISEKTKRAFSDAFRVFRSFQISIDPSGAYGFGFDVQPAHGRADSGQLATDLSELLESLGVAAGHEGAGVLVAIDELQEAGQKDLAALNVALHQLGQAPRPVPVVFVGTGLPSLPAALAKASSYAERMYLYATLGPLTPTDTREALVVPSQRERVTWADDALDLVANVSAGYPYFVQACGKHIWDVAPAKTITADDATIGFQRARDELDSGLYKTRWERATTYSQEVMRAMAPSGDEPISVAVISAAMGRTQTAWSQARRQLIDAGLIYAPRRGMLAFTVPGMADYITRCHE